MYLKSVGALCARTLSYESCEFQLVDGVSDAKVGALYNRAAAIWTDLHAQLAEQCKKLNAGHEMNADIDQWKKDMGEDAELTEEMRYHLDLHKDSDSESNDEEDARFAEERKLRRIYRKRQSKFLRGQQQQSLLHLQKHSVPLTRIMYLSNKGCSGQHTNGSFEGEQE